MEVTHELAQRARLAGACNVPPVGTPIERLTFSELLWVADHRLIGDLEFVAVRKPACVKRGLVPFWALSGYGSGSGGSGSGGYGFGSGGYGDGSGSGGDDGYGDGGDGYGGYGYGGYGDGGYGDGGGDGSGGGLDLT